jgi:hypothetical protein
MKHTASPTRTYQPGELAWAARSSEIITRFLRKNSIAARDPNAELVLLSAAGLLWERRQGSPAWGQVPIAELFRRLAVQQEYFADPALVLAFYEVLHVFVSWLCTERLITEQRCDAMVEALESVKVPLVEDARRLLLARRRAQEKQGVWSEVLKTMPG